MKITKVQNKKLICLLFDKHDAHGWEHIRRTLNFAHIIAKDIKFTKEEMEYLDYAVLLHDIGYIIGEKIQL